MIVEKQHGQFLKAIYRKFGYRVAYYLDKNTEVTPNQLTLYRLLFNQIGALLVAFSTNRFSLFVAGILFLTWRALDAADGCLAQIQDRKSLAGDWLDSTLDRYGYACMFCSTSIYMYSTAPEQYLTSLVPMISMGIFFSISLNFITRRGYQLDEKEGVEVTEAKEQSSSQRIFSNIAAYSDNSVIFIVFGCLFGFLYGAALFLGLYLAMSWFYIFFKTLKRVKRV